MADNEETQVEGQESAPAAPATEAAPRQKKAGFKRKKTWQEKLDNGDALTELEDTKSEADYSVRRHLREQKERQAFEARKARTRSRKEAAANTGGDE